MNKISTLFNIILLLTIIILQSIVAYYAWDKCHYLIISILILCFIKNINIKIEKIKDNLENKNGI